MRLHLNHHTYAYFTEKNEMKMKKQKKIIIFLSLLLLSSNSFSQSESFILNNFDNYDPNDSDPCFSCDGVYHNSWNFVTGTLKLNYDTSKQIKGSKAFLEYSRIGEGENSDKFVWDLYFPHGGERWQQPDLPDLKIKNKSVSFTLKTNTTDTFEVDFWLDFSEKSFVSSKTLLLTNNKWKTYNYKLEDFQWKEVLSGIQNKPNPDSLIKTIETSFFTNPAKNLNISIDNIKLDDFSYLDTFVIYSILNTKIVCGDKVQLSVSTNYPDTAKLTYFWSPSDGLSENNMANPFVDLNSNKTYVVTIKTSDGKTSTDSVKVIVDPLKSKINFTNANCGELGQLNIKTNRSNEDNLIYKWIPETGLSDSNIKNPTVAVTSPTKYLVEVTTESGCLAKDSITITPKPNSVTPQICLVTVDPQTGKNKIIWDKTPNIGIKTYKIKRESTVAGVYSEIANIPYNSINSYIDVNSTPNKHADRYILTTVDSCDNESEPSSVHQTIHLTISQGLPGTYNLIWSPYVGFDYKSYYIYKGSSPDNLTLVDSLSSTYISATDTAQGIAYYQIAVKRQDPCFIESLLKSAKAGNASSEPNSHSISNIDDNLKFVGSKVNTENILSARVYPNPFENNISIETNFSSPSKLKIELYNVFGSKIYEYASHEPVSGRYKHQINTQNFLLTTNVLLLKFEVNGNVYYQKLLKK
jgi:hypothetical protein